MAMHVCNGAMTACTFGVAPSTLTVLPINRVLTSSQPAANIMDHMPMVNVMPVRDVYVAVQPGRSRRRRPPRSAS